MKFEEMCLETARDFSPLFTTVSNCLIPKTFGDVFNGVHIICCTRVNYASALK